MAESRLPVFAPIRQHANRIIAEWLAQRLAERITEPETWAREIELALNAASAE
jgi:hypothetical protein